MVPREDGPRTGSPGPLDKRGHGRAEAGRPSRCPGPWPLRRGKGTPRSRPWHRGFVSCGKRSSTWRRRPPTWGRPRARLHRPHAEPAGRGTASLGTRHPRPAEGRRPHDFTDSHMVGAATPASDRGQLGSPAGIGACGARPSLRTKGQSGSDVLEAGGLSRRDGHPPTWSCCGTLLCRSPGTGEAAATTW